MDNIFAIKKGYNSITVVKNGTQFSIHQSPDNDIWFKSFGDIELALSFDSSDQEEWQCYIIFERLMKLIVGKYVLNDEAKHKYSLLPKDFVNLQNKEINWHSDSGDDNILKLKLHENKIIVSIARTENKRNFNNDIRVRIRTSGSDYGCYYQEFVSFFNELFNFACQVDLMKKQNNSLNETPQDVQKNLSLFKK